MFKCIAPDGLKVARRLIVDENNTPVLRINTGEYLQRLGNLRESYVQLIENGEITEDIHCDFGGVIRPILRYLNGKPVTDLERYTLRDVIPYLDKIKEKAPDIIAITRIRRSRVGHTRPIITILVQSSKQVHGRVSMRLPACNTRFSGESCQAKLVRMVQARQ